jgi:hypothetical protein
MELTPLVLSSDFSPLLKGGKTLLMKDIVDTKFHVCWFWNLLILLVPP